MSYCEKYLTKTRERDDVLANISFSRSVSPPLVAIPCQLLRKCKHSAVEKVSVRVRCQFLNRHSKKISVNVQCRAEKKVAPFQAQDMPCPKRYSVNGAYKFNIKQNG